MAIWSLAGKDSNSYSSLSSEQTCVQVTQDSSRKQSGLSDEYREHVIFTAFHKQTGVHFSDYIKNYTGECVFPSRSESFSDNIHPEGLYRLPFLSADWAFSFSFQFFHFSFLLHCHLPIPSMHPMRSRRQTNTDFHTAPTAWLFQHCFTLGEESFISQIDQLWLKTYFK